MTVENNASRNQYIATGAQTVFPYTFEIFTKDDVAVYAGTTELSEGTDYTVSGVGVDSGGNITLTSGATANVIYTIFRDMPLDRLNDYQQSGDFLAEEVNDDFDRLWLAISQQKSSINLAIRAPETDSVMTSANTLLPSVEDRAHKVIGFDAAGRLDYQTVFGGDIAYPFAPVVPQSFGAVGDGIADDTAALQLWANVGGLLFLPRGLYRTTGGILLDPTTTVFGESAGSGTGGGKETTLAAEALAGASIIVPDPSSWNSDDYVFKFEGSPTNANSAAPSCSVRDFKIECPRAGGVPAHMLVFANPYDSMSVRNINLNFAHQDYNALRIERTSYSNYGVGQTGLIENVVAIGDDTGAATTTPVVYVHRMQEMQMIGVKSFGGAQSIGYANRVPIALEGCRGFTLVGCSSALTSNYGLDIYSTDRSTDGISIIGHTFEVCELGGFLLDGETRNDVAVTVTNVTVTAPRYQFPQAIACVINTASSCTIESSFKEVYCIGESSNNQFTGSRLDLFSNTVVGSSLRKSNVYSTRAGADDTINRSSADLGIQRPSPAFKFISPDGLTEYRFLASIDDAGVDLGMNLLDVNGDSYVTHNADSLGSTELARDGAGLLFNTPDGTKKYRLTVDDLGNPLLVNTVTGSDLTFDLDKPVDVAGAATNLDSAKTGKTTYMQSASANTFNILADATVPVVLNNVTMVFQEGAGQTTIQAAAGVTLNGVVAGSCTIEDQYTGATLVKRGADEWVVTGNISVVA